MPDPIERPSGASQIVIQKHQYPLKVYLIFVFGLVLVAFAWGGFGWTRSPINASPNDSSVALAAQLTPYILERTVVVTAAPTSTPTLLAWAKTATAMPTPTRIPLQPTRTPTQSFRPVQSTNGGQDTR